MGLSQLNIKGQNKVEFAIKVLQICEPPEGYYLADSGGKDSSVVRDLCIKSGVKFDAHYCVSPIDPPQIYQFLKEHHPDTQWDYYARGFWKLVRKKGLPSLDKRWCCEIIKESGGDKRIVVTGIRRSESRKRARRCFIGIPKSIKEDKVLINPIIYFDDYDIWDYIRNNNIPYCHLYDEGFARLGCVLCPLANTKQRLMEQDYFPKIANNWKRACDRIVEDYKARNYISKKGKPMKFKPQTGEELYQWWVSRK